MDNIEYYITMLYVYSMQYRNDVSNTSMRCLNKYYYFANTIHSPGAKHPTNHAMLLTVATD